MKVGVQIKGPGQALGRLQEERLRQRLMDMHRNSRKTLKNATTADDGQVFDEWHTDQIIRGDDVGL